MNTIVEYGVNETNNGEFIGFVRVFDKSKWIFSENCGIYRLEYDDALHDGYLLATSFLSENKGISIEIIEE